MDKGDFGGVRQPQIDKKFQEKGIRSESGEKS
ncbi:hypothetical protein J3R74_002570 [Puniceicoccus vermicola]